MNQSTLGLMLYVFLIVPPVTYFMESIMIIHMHMQMPMLVIAGLLMGRFIIDKFPNFFEKWNNNGIPGILLFVMIIVYWMLPRTMDEALTEPFIEIFKFISLPFLAGVSLRDSWKKLGENWKNGIVFLFAALSIGMGWLYTTSPVQLCNNYLVMEQITLGWAFITLAICLVIYLIYTHFVDHSQYE